MTRLPMNYCIGTSKKPTKLQPLNFHTKASQAYIDKKIASSANEAGKTWFPCVVAWKYVLIYCPVQESIQNVLKT